MSDFEDERLDEDLEDDWEAMMAKEEEEEARKAAELLAAKNKKPRKPKHLREEGDDDEDYEDDEDLYANETEEERRARVELQRQIEAQQDTAGIFGSSTDHTVAELSDAPALVTWEKAKTPADITKIRERIQEVVTRFSKNPNFLACILPAFQSMLKGMDTASLENMRTYLDTCKDPIDAKRAEKKEKKKQAEEAAKKEAEEATVSRQTQRARETGDLFGSVEDRAGVNQSEDAYSMF